MSKERKQVRYIHCAKCGGTQGTLVKKGGTNEEKKYEHMREQDCQRHRASEAKKANILAQVKPVKETI